ncbi:hypothetical protein [Ectopseudomonas khazarica]|uniref:hypothetical protein n=1 Tax=Ectopseudomonas khazarica TaxID=2502979 RepID=UPI0037CBA38F
MKHIGFFRPDFFVRLLNWIGLPIAGLYIFCMFLFPWVAGGGDWQYVQKVWSHWQGLNVGMLAFISSVVAFNISTYNAQNQREREFQAAKAFLPASLSELCTYFKSSAAVFMQAWNVSGQERPELIAPIIPEGYKQVFSDCIKHATPEVGAYLSNILVWLQVHDSRIRDFTIQFYDRGYINPNRHTLISYFYRLAELRALVNKIFDFSRGMEDFDSRPLVWDDFRTALRNMDVWYENIRIDDNMALEPYIKGVIERGENKNT